MASLPAGTATMPTSVLLVHMPMADPTLPNLGIELLAQILRGAGIRCDVLYGSLLMPPAIAKETLHGLVGHAAFTPHYFDLDVDDFVREVVDGMGASADARSALENEVHTAITAAEICLERCLADVAVEQYDLVGFSAIFDTQKMPSAALAKRLKLREPGVIILFGGTGCDGEMASALLEHFPEVDAVMSGDAEDTITAAVRFLVGGGAHRGRSPVANLSVRRPRTALTAVQDGTISSLRDRLTPDYTSFIRQLARSPYIGRFPLTLLFEASRGCWWGDKNHCSFCGIRQVHEGYRERAADDVRDEIVTLFERHRPSLMYATDAILSRNHLRQLLPSLAEHRMTRDKGLALFFEMKSNATRKDVALLAAAGVVAVQPGIESFSSAALARIKKGAVGIRQLEALKWFRAYDIDVIYGLMVKTPGETASELAESVKLIPHLHHLQPPRGVNPLSLHRFSPYFISPHLFGFRDIRPHRMQEVAYRGPRERLMRLCYELDYTSRETEDPALSDVIEALCAAVKDWSRAFAQRAQLTMTESEDGIMIWRSSGSEVEARQLSQREASVYRAITHVASVAAVAELAELAPEQCESILEGFREKGLAICLDHAWLGLALPVALNPAHDAGLRASSLSASAEPMMGYSP